MPEEAEHEEGSERAAGRQSAGGRFAPVPGRRLAMVGLTVLLVSVGLIMIGMSARSLSEQRAETANARPVPGAPSPSTAGASGRPGSPTTEPHTTKKAGGTSHGGTSHGGSGRRTVDPVNISIPTIGVRTSVMELGLSADNTVEVPPYDKADDVGWYTQSPTPGDTGPSVLIGHVDSPKGPAVFARMAQLEAGDRVSVKRSDGTVAVFAVDRVTTFDKDKFPTREVYGNTDHAALRLITCGGSYDRTAGGYQANTVAFADLVTIKQTKHNKQ